MRIRDILSKLPDTAKPEQSQAEYPAAAQQHADDSHMNTDTGTAEPGAE